MVSTSTMTRLQLNPTAKNSTEPFDVTDLDDIVNFLSSNAGLELGRAKQTRFWIISALMFLMAVLYFITIIKNITIRNYWLVERNKNGYLNPNIEVLIPLFSVIHSSLVFCSIVLMHQDNGRYLSQPTMVTQLVSYNFLFYSAATRVWRTLSVIPLVPVQLTAHGTSLLSNGFPPFLFNTLVVLLYMSFPVATLPVGLTMARGAGKIGREVYNLIPNLKLLIAQQDAFPDRALPPFLVNQIDITLESLHVTVVRILGFFDVFGVPNRRSATQVGIITFEWSGWAWSVPGSVLAFVTCCVALVPHSASEVTTKATPTRNSVRKSGAKDNRYPPELSRTSTESDAVNLRPFGDEKIGDHVVHPISPGHGIDIPNDTVVGQPPMSHTSPSSPRKDLLPLRQMGSDINIIKSLRQQHP
ncbi:hypothetical protein KEM48_002489 [Puccinia striiformis f. sp. tritici PST-130]|nr:hypothetical protein KEM48_002489 [Puccinia striiformis f. sp. tritici PST-130]